MFRVFKRVSAVMLQLSAGYVLLCSSSIVANDHELTVVSNLLPPFSIESDGKLDGFSVELLGILMRNQYGNDVVSDRVPVPFTRVLATLSNKPQSVAINIACTEDRKDKYKWLGPYYRFEMAVIGKANTGESWANIEAIKEQKVVVVSNTALEEILIKQGFPKENIIEVAYPIQAIAMVMADRVSLMAHIPSVINYIAKQSPDFAKLQLENMLTLREGMFYFALSNDFDDQLVEQLQEQLEAILDSDEVAELYTKYDLTPMSLSSSYSCN